MLEDICKKNSIPNGTGERAAMGGYTHQYDEFARKVYECIIDGSLEEIRVADADDNVGKLDDICYATEREVHGYQVKWTNSNNSFKYNDFKELLPSIVDGWRKLKILYPNKNVIPHLLTNRPYSENDRGIYNKEGQVIGPFIQYKSNVLDKLKDGSAIEAKWADTLSELKVFSTLTDEEGPLFWDSFAMDYFDEQDEIRVEIKYSDKRIEDLLDLARLIQMMASRKERKALATRHEIVRMLNWSDRFNTTYNHNLSVTSSSYEPITDAILQLNRLLTSKSKGYIFLEGTPGSGKSTLLTQWSRLIPEISIRYYAFDFTDPSSQLNNDSNRGDKTVFLYDVLKMMESYGFKGEGHTLLYRDYSFLKNRFQDTIKIIGKSFTESGSKVILIVDGLDHIVREYTSCVTTLMGVLPSSNEIPEGLIILLGSQYFTGLGLNRSIELEYLEGASTVKMPPFNKKAVESLASKLLNKKIVTPALIRECMDKSQGHPLFLRYLLNKIQEEGPDVIKKISPYDGDIENYYAGIIGKTLQDAKLEEFLGLLSRVVGDVKLDFIREWDVEKQTQKLFKKEASHLFVHNTETKEISFFHNSFRQYLLHETAKDEFDGVYSQLINKEYYRKLADYVRKSKVMNQWEIGTYLYKAEEYDEFIELLTPDCLIEQVKNFRPLWHVRRDIERASKIAAIKKDVYLLVRFLLLQSQIDQMGMQDFSALELTDDFINLGMTNLAKIQIREGRDLHCNQVYAMELARKFFLLGDLGEANLLFELSYPQFLEKRPNEFHQRYNEMRNHQKELEEWVFTASYFLPEEQIEKEIDVFINYLQSLADYDNEQFDSTTSCFNLKYKLVESLISQHRWVDANNYLNTFPVDDYPLINYIAKREIYVELKKSCLDDDMCNSAFTDLKEAFNNLSQDERPYLQMAYLSYQQGQKTTVIRSFLDNRTWDSLGTYYLEEVRESFSKLENHIKYIFLRAYCGFLDNMNVIVPDNPQKKHSDLMVMYARKVFYLAQLSGKASHETQSDVEFLSLIKPYMSFFDGLSFSNYNRYSYTISEQRGDFYEFIVKMAACYSKETVEKVAVLAKEYFSTPTCKARTDAIRKFVLALYHEGLNINYVTSMLNEIELTMLDGQDLDGRQSETLKQAKAWLKIGNNDKAKVLFHRMIQESSGIGYRKDHQPSTFAEWIGKANNADPANAIGRIHWLTKRLRHLDTIAETRTGTYACTQLLTDAFKLNLGMSVKFSKWILNSEFGYFESISGIIVKALLERASDEKEYKAILHLYTRIHLYIMNDDVASSLLELLYKKGANILDKEFAKYISDLRLAISTRCPEGFQDVLNEQLDKLISPSTEANESSKKNTYQNESDKLYIEAEGLFLQNKKLEAWDKAMEALTTSSSAGWARFYDGGTRIKACQLLQKIDKDRGREITINQFAEDITKEIGYLAMQNIDEIIPLLSDDVNPLKIFDEEFGYMNRMLREDSICNEDCPEIMPEDKTIADVIASWLLYIAEMPITCISEEAKKQLAYLIDDGYNFILDNFCHQVDILLEVGMYVRELKSSNLYIFKDIALQYAVSENYKYRLYSRTILISLGESIPEAPMKALPAIYKFSLPEIKKIEFELNPSPYSGKVNWEDPSSVMSVVRHISYYLRDYFEIETLNIETRAMQLMKHYGKTNDWDDIADSRVGAHYNNIGLQYPYRRPRAKAAINGMMEVAAELLDTKIENGVYNDDVFMMTDFSSIFTKEVPRPEFIERITKRDSWGTPKGWEHNAKESTRFVDYLIKYNDMYVVGEFSMAIRSEDKIPKDTFKMKISFDNVKSTSDGFFGSSPYQRPTFKYSEFGNEDPELILIREGYLIPCSRNQIWLAFNPACAKMLGWRLSKDGMFVWVDTSGNKMVESVYWESGNTFYRNRSNQEVGDGWLVLASEQAIEALQTIGSIYVHQVDERTLEDESILPMDSEYKIYPLQIDSIGVLPNSDENDKNITT